MSKTLEIEIWEFERKSFIHWRSPFLPDDPPHFVSRDQQQLNHLDEYKLNIEYTFDKTNEWHIQSENGWIYSDHFQSKKWSKNQFSSSHLCRKRCWKRTAKKQFVSKITKVHSTSALLNLNEEKEVEFKYETNHNMTGNSINNNMYEYIIHQVEINQSSNSKWKPYQNGWFDQNMKPLKTIEAPYDIKLSELHKIKKDGKQNGGTWKWSENWWCIDTDESVNSNTENILYNNNNNNNIRLQSLKYMSTMSLISANTITSLNEYNEEEYEYEEEEEEEEYYDNISADMEQKSSQQPQTNDIIMEQKSEIKIQQTEPEKKIKKKKRIRIKKNAKKLFRKMKGKKDNNKNRLKPYKSEADLLKLTSNKRKQAKTSATVRGNRRNGRKDSETETLLLSPTEQNELHELFTNIERGWSYAYKYSQQDSEWNPENKIIAKCSYRRRTWVRCAIYDISPYYESNKQEQKEEKKANEFEEKEKEIPVLTKSDSLSKSIARTKSKANDLIAMIDDVLSGQNSIGILNDNKQANNTHSMSKHNKKNEKYNDIKIGRFIMSEALNALLWHIHLCSQSNVIDRLPNNNKKNNNKIKKIGKLYFQDNMRLRSRQMDDFIKCLMRLSFDYLCISDDDIRECEERYIINNIDITSDDGIIEICRIIYNDLLSDVLYQCSFHQSTQIYTNQQRAQLMNKINDIIILYSILQKTQSLSTITELILLMSSLMKFIEKSKDDEVYDEAYDETYENEDDNINNPLWILDDLLNIGQQFLNVSSFELSCLFLPDMLTNLKHFLFILSKLNIKTLSRRERKLCSNVTQNILAILESYFQKLHDNVRPKTVVQLLQIFISLTDIFENMTRKSVKTTFKQIRDFLREYHKLSIEKAYKSVSDENIITLQLFIINDIEKLKNIISNMDINIKNNREKSMSVISILSPRTQQNERDTQQISFKLAAEYEYENENKNELEEKKETKALTHEEIEKKHEKILNKHFRNKQVTDEWWQYIDDILHLIDNDYAISIALWKGKIFQTIPTIGIQHLASECGKDFAGSFMNNPHSLDISYKLLLCGAHKIQDRLDAICCKINALNGNQKLNIGKIFSFVQYEIFERLSYWMDLSMNRVAIWIKRAAEKETWIPPKEEEMEKNKLLMTFKKKNKNENKQNHSITWGKFVTDSFSFIHNELDAFFDHLISFPSEGMSMANVFFQRLQFLVETILHLTEMSMRDCTFLDNVLEEKEKEIKEENHMNKKRRETRANVRDEVSKMEEQINENGVLKKAKRKQMIDDFNREYIGQINESIIKGRDILNKFAETLDKDEKTNNRLDGLKSIADIIENAQQIDNELRNPLSGLPSLQRIEDEQFHNELKYICVKFSSLSRCIEIINSLSGYLLNKIQCISAPTKQQTLKKKFEMHKQELIKSAYKFITNCKSEAKQCVERAVNRMVFQLLSVQNGAYFKLKLYIYGRIPSTTAIKIGLFQRIADYLNVCSDYLTENDLQIIVVEIATRFCRHMKEILIGYCMKPPRVFRKDIDTKFILNDFHECKKLFCDFGLREMNTYLKQEVKQQQQEDEEKKEERIIDVDDFDDLDKQHPFYPYFICIENMKRSTLKLMQKHMILMAKRNEEEKNKLSALQLKEKEKENKNLKLKSLANVSRHESIRAKAIMDRARIKEIYDSIELHVLTHRSQDDEALSYVENFIQYRNKNKPLIIDLSNIGDTLRIIIHEGKDLPALDFTGKSDPFVKIKIMPFKLYKQTRVVRQTLNPKWDQPLDFKLKKIMNQIQHIIIEFDCWDWDTIGSDDHIGKYTERIEYGQENIHEKWCALYQDNNQKIKGQLLITIECENLWI